MAYHLATNGLVERQNRKIIQTLRQLVGPYSSHWDEWLPQVAATLNSSLHKSISETPHFVGFFCQDKRLSYTLLSEKPQPVYNFDD